MSAPDPATVKVVPSNDAEPATPTAPTSASAHGSGSVLGADVTVTVLAADVVVRPALSVATAETEYCPAATFDQVAVYGAVVATPSDVEPAKNSTFVIVPSVSEAAALSVIVAGAV